MASSQENWDLIVQSALNVESALNLNPGTEKNAEYKAFSAAYKIAENAMNNGNPVTDRMRSNVTTHASKYVDRPLR
jgi:hypothetical protein